MIDALRTSVNGDGGTPVLADLSRVVAEVVRLAKVPPQRISVTLGAASIEVEWGESGGVGVQPAAAPPQEPVEDTDTGQLRVCSPLVGTFYCSPQPGAAPFVAVGDVVETGQQVAIVEAMKLMNPVEATEPGQVARVLVGDGEAVEYGQPLFLLDPL
jgi:acetyl-CoA carboxylase biotin carboxyl carrier protein